MAIAKAKWFDDETYVINKLAQMKTIDPDYSLADLELAFERAGFSGEEGHYQHFLKYGNTENVSPSMYFDVEYYFHSKAAQYYEVDFDDVTDDQINLMKVKFKKVGLSAWDHYLKYGMHEGIDPNENFDTSAYMEAKLALMQATDPDYSMTQLEEAFKSANLNPVEHYCNYGVNEGIVPTYVSVSESDSTHALTVGDDYLVGKTVANVHDYTIDDNFNDYFKAEVGTLNSADTVDGLGGTDTLYARVNANGPAGELEPTVKNVEKVLFQSQIGTGQEAAGAAPVSAYIDADRITLADTAQLTIGSANSRAHLMIEDVSHNSNFTTVRFADADPTVDFRVYFDPQNLKANDAETSGKLYLKLMDVKSADEEGLYLKTSPYDGIKFSYNDSVDISLRFSEDDVDKYTGSAANYNTLLAAFQNAIDDFVAKNPSYDGIFSVALGEPFDTVATVDSVVYTGENGRTIVLSASTGTIEGLNWLLSSGEAPRSNRYVAEMDEQADTTCPLIQTTVELTNVGRVQWQDASECLPDDIIKGSNAGDLQIGSMSMRSGIERMDVKVDEGSWLSGLYSTNDTLRMVTVEAKDINEDGLVGKTIAAHLNNSSKNTDTADGQLYIGTWEGKLDDNGNGTSNLTWADPARLLSANGGLEVVNPQLDENGLLLDIAYRDAVNPTGLKDVAVFDATEEGVFAGDINIAAVISDASYDKYLKGIDVYSLDSDGNPVKNAPLDGYDGYFTYNTGSGDDTVNMTVAGDIAADVDFKLNIQTNTGDDLVAFRYGTLIDSYVVDKLSLQQDINQKDLQNVHIYTNDGDDAVWFYGGIVTGDDDAPQIVALGGSVDIATGAGNDAVYANQIDLTTGGAGSGVTYGTANYNAVWAFNTDATNIGIDGFNGATLNNDLGTGTATFVKTENYDQLVATVSFKGFTATGTIGDLNTRSTVITAEDLNHAVMRAIDGNTVLSKLLVAKDGADHSLLIESLVNNEFETTDLRITFQTGISTSWDDHHEVVNTGDKYNSRFATEDSEAGFEYDGFDLSDLNPDLISQAIVDAGDGHDVIALAHNGATDIIKVSDTFGTNVILGFEVADNENDPSDQIDASGLGLSSLGYLAGNYAVAGAGNGSYFVKIGDHSGKIVNVANGAITQTYGTFHFDDDVDVDSSIVDLIAVSANDVNDLV